MKKVSLFNIVIILIISIFSCGGGGGGGMASFSETSLLNNGGDAGGWGNGNLTGNGLGSAGSSNASLSSGAGTFTAPSDINWKSIMLSIRVTSEGTTTTHTLTNTETEAIANLLTSLKKGDVVEVSAEITMDDDSIRTTDSGAVTIGIGDNRISLPTPYSFTCDESSGNAYEDRYSNAGYSAPEIGEASFSSSTDGIYTVNNASAILPAATAPGYKFDHWETSDGQTYVPGVSRGDVTIKPLFVPDYTCDYGYLGDTVLITNQQEFTDFMENHQLRDFSGKTIVLDCDVSAEKMFYNNGGFYGTFDGRGHTVTLTGNRITMNDGTTYYAGLFSKNAGTIISVKVSGSLTAFFNGSGSAGGIAAINASGGVIMNCVNLATIESKISFTGGIVGKNEGIIQYCYNKGAVRNNSTETPRAGGITGLNSASITHCYNKGEISGSDPDCLIGGITGVYSGGHIYNCYNTFEGSGNFAALCGYASATDVTNFYYDTNLTLCGNGGVGVTYPLSDVSDLADSNTSIWVMLLGATLPTLITNPE